MPPPPRATLSPFHSPLQRRAGRPFFPRPLPGTHLKYLRPAESTHGPGYFFSSSAWRKQLLLPRGKKEPSAARLRAEQHKGGFQGRAEPSRAGPGAFRPELAPPPRNPLPPCPCPAPLDSVRPSFPTHVRLQNGWRAEMESRLPRSLAPTGCQQRAGREYDFPARETSSQELRAASSGREARQCVAAMG